MAALLVVYYHSALQANVLWPGQSHLIPFGKCGVDLFFVLSGYLMWQSTKNKPYSTNRFYKKRLARIAPLYWALTVLAATIALFAPALLHSTRFDGMHLVASLMFIPWPNPASHGSLADLMTPVIVPGWTLNFEMLFYAFFGLALLGPLRWRLLRVIALFATFIVAVVVFGPDYLTLWFYDPFLLLEFLVGIGVAIASSAMQDRRLDTDWTLLFASGFLLIALDISNFAVSRFFVSGLPAAFILYSLVRIETNGGWPTVPLFVTVGDSSYSLYLVHIFVLAGLRVALTPFKNEIDVVLLQGLLVAAALTISILAGLVTWKLIECPLVRLASSLLGIGSTPAKPVMKPTPVERSPAARDPSIDNHRVLDQGDGFYLHRFRVF